MKRRNLFLDVVDGPRLYADDRHRRNLEQAAKDSLDLLQRMKRSRTLNVHTGCVNTLCWSDNGEVLLSGSDDRNLAITTPHLGLTKHVVQTRHRANILCARFVPHSQNNEVVSCSKDGEVVYANLEHLTPDRTVRSCVFDCMKRGPTYQVAMPQSEPRSLFACGDDGFVRLYDLRKESSCQQGYCLDHQVINIMAKITTIAIDPVRDHYIAVGCNEYGIYVFDRRALRVTECKPNGPTVPLKFFRNPIQPYFSGLRITSLQYDATGEQLLAHFSSSDAYLFDVTGSGEEQDKPLPLQLLEPPPMPSMQPLPPMQLRLRNDWSDTGPNARTASELAAEPDLDHNRMMTRMTNLMTRLMADERSAEQQAELAAQSASFAKLLSDGNARPPPLGDALPAPKLPPYVVRKFTGHRNSRTYMKQAVFWGNNYVMAGSECGHVFAWDRHTGKVVLLLEADRDEVNQVAPHPTRPMIATSGTEHNIKLWEPLLRKSSFDQELADKVLKRNAVMLDPTKNNATVTATSMVRLLANLTARRNSGGARRTARPNVPPADERP